MCFAWLAHQISHYKIGKRECRVSHTLHRRRQHTMTKCLLLSSSSSSFSSSLTSSSQASDDDSDNDRRHNCRSIRRLTSHDKSAGTLLVAALTLFLVVTSSPVVDGRYLGPKLSHIVVDNTTGVVYVGGENRLYQLTADLVELMHVDTGPQNDSVKCYPPPRDCFVERTLTNDYTKVLLVDYQRRKLITCGSLFQGQCQVRSLANISKWTGPPHNRDLQNSAVAANTETGSTVAFMAPGPPSVTGSALYVAASYTGVDPESRAYRNLVPAIALRSLDRDNPFSLAKAGGSFLQKSSTALFLKSAIAPTFPIRYITGFSTSARISNNEEKTGFSYFLTVQNDAVDPPKRTGLVTKIIQLCQGESFHYSYADIPLKCSKDGVDYNVLQAARHVHTDHVLGHNLFRGHDPMDVILGVFSTEPKGEGQGQVDSALCLFTMQSIREQFLRNIKLCHQGNTSVSGGGYLQVGPRGNCYHRSGLVKNNQDDGVLYLCNTHKLESFSNIVGTIPAVARPLIEYPGVKLTSVIASRVREFTVAFLGTGDGRLKKLVVNDDQKAVEYGEHVISEDGEAVLPDMAFDKTEQHLYVMTESTVTKVQLQSCSQAQTCHDCLKDDDPYCGWCSLENKCGLQASCPKSEDWNQYRWLHGVNNPCISISTIAPPAASVNTAGDLHLTIAHLPDTSSNTFYTCDFLELGWSSPVTFWYFGARCPSPDFNKEGLSLDLEGSKTVTLALNSTETGKLFVAKNFTFYNCSNFHSCSSCVSANFDCDWCIYENKCYDNTSSCKTNVVRAKGSAKPGIKGPQHCPKIDTNATGSLYMPVGLKKTILLKGFNIPELTSKYKSFQCVLDTGSQRLTSDAKRHDDKSLTCDIPPLNYKEKTGTLEADLSVYWGDGFLLETTQKLVATLYKCDVLASDDCSLCKNLNYSRHYLECVWCHQKCIHTSGCLQHTNEVCPVPKIDAVWPLTGPIQGGTNITIVGSNLGEKYEDVLNAVSVAYVGCKPHQELYSPSKRIVCQTGWHDPGQGPIVLRLKSRVTQYHKPFQYKSPILESIHPNAGPKSGGSTLTIYGRDLNIGNNHTVFLKDVPCHVIKSRVRNGSIECVTSKVVWTPEPKGPIKVYFDGNERSLNQYFMYKEDPYITGIAPLKSILEGGRTMTVTGKEFSYIQQPELFAYVSTMNGELYPTNSTKCKVMNNEVMKCPSPRLVDSLKNIIRSKRSAVSATGVSTDRSTQPIEVVQVAFRMDAVPTVLNLSTTPNLNYFLKYFPNPQVFNFTEKNGIKLQKGNALIIEGADLNVAASKSDVSVTIGSAVCTVTTFSRSQIVCKLPASKPGEKGGVQGSNGKAYPYVRVQINNHEVCVGQIMWEVPKTFSFPSEAIAGIAAGGSFLVIVIVIILIIYRRKNTKAERIYRKLQIQLDNLESNVRNECKHAFAELQTDMTDLTGDLVSSGIPFWDFHSYIFKVLFPGMTDHIILHPPIQKNGRFQFSDHGLQLFHQLLNNKLFLTTFVRTMEEQRAFSIRDRANVASLLMIVYLNNMEYATEILKCLLVDLVQKSVEGRHPKLMLRRSESVVEKLLTNWLSICLYKYLRDIAGGSLFMLYKAIKLQAEKGPVDAVTGDARYSLSEDTLLREKIEPKVLLLNVESCGEVIQCRILDCDTISQAKEKILDHIYRNIPFSQRPNVRDLELEWRNGPTGPIVLTDTDIASQNKDGWRRYNTLAFYRVHDGAYMSLIHRQQTLKSLNGSLDNSVLSLGSVSPILKKEENGCKEWHLVKHDDSFVKDGGVKMISEIFLTRLLSTKGTLQKYVDDFFKNIMGGSPCVPPVVKYLFDFLDQQALIHGITDYEVVHTWKCNSLPLRFWVNIIKNPEFVFDVHKPRIVDSCLSVVAQTFMDSCSTTEHRLGKDSPSNKLLFAKDIVNYRKLVEKYFTDISSMPSLTEQDMTVFLADISRTSPKLFYISSALGELYKYVSKYKNELMESLEQDNQANSQQLSCKLGHVISCMEGPSGTMAYV